MLSSVDSNHPNVCDSLMEEDSCTQTLLSSGSLGNFKPPVIGQISILMKRQRNITFITPPKLDSLSEKERQKWWTVSSFLVSLYVIRKVFANVVKLRGTMEKKRARFSREMKCGCEASCCIKRGSDSERWYVWSVKEAHNHAMVAPLKHRYLRKNRVIPPWSRELFKSLNHLNLAPSKHFKK